MMNYGATIPMLLLSNLRQESPVCPEVEVQQNFDASRYYGNWFLQNNSYLFTAISPKATCSTATYLPKGDGKISVANYDVIDGMLGSTFGEAYCEQGVGNCYVSFFNLPYPEQPNYQILATDYDNFTIVYSCSEMYGNQIAWVLSRTPVMSEEDLTAALMLLKQKVPSFDLSTLTPQTPQGEVCTYEQLFI